MLEKRDRKNTDISPCDSVVSEKKNLLGIDKTKKSIRFTERD